MRDKNYKPLIKAVIIVISALLWLAAWELAAHLIGFEVIFPGPIETFGTLLTLVKTAVFWKTVFLSIARIMAGLGIGIAVGVLLALVCRLLPFTYHFISIGMTVIKSTPVASIVLILWVLISGSYLPTLIGVLMVAPIIWQNLIDGYAAIDGQLLEVAKVFEFSRIKTARTIIIPTLLRFFVPAILTSVGLAWKSGIAAEIIAYTSYSIGKYIANAKANFEGGEMMAWTVVVVVFSLIFEYSIRLVLRRLGEKNAGNK